MTLTVYISRVFVLAVLGMACALSGLVALFDFIELLRRAATKPEATFDRVAGIAALRLPQFALEILPFAVLLGGIVAFWRLTRSSELIVARAAGISAWQFLSGPVLCAIGLGVFAVAALSPISAAMRARAEAIEDSALRAGGGKLALNGGQLWLRQLDRGLDPAGVAMLHARAVRLVDERFEARDLSVFRLGRDDQMLARIEAGHARLEPGAWVLEDGRLITPGHPPEPPRTLVLPTEFTVDRMQDSFASPDTFSVWALPDFIALLERSGFSAIRHRLHLQSLLALPLLCGTMSLLAAGFSMRPARRGGVARIIAGGVAAGFALFVVSKLAEQFGQSGALPVPLAAWAPAAAGLLLAISLLLHLEDG